MSADDLVDKVAFRLYNGETGDFHRGIGELQLVVALRRSQAAREFGFMLMQKLQSDGYIVVSDINHLLFEFDTKELESQGEFYED